ncbi:MAG: FAD-binding oxidoreductase [Alphaproteobacteria bacterium]
MADVVVVGGGILGVSVAYAVSRLGQRVVLLEERTLASGTTGASFAWLNATAKADDQAYHRLNRRGIGRHLDLAAMWGEETVGLAGTGSIHWSHPGAPDGGPVAVMARAEYLENWGYPIVALDRSTLQALEPYIDFPTGSQGFLAPLDRWIDAPRLVRRLADETREEGGDVREGSAVTGFIFDGESVVGVEVGAARVVAPIVVLTAGTGLPALAARARRSLAQPLPVRLSPGLLVDTPPLERAWLRHVVYFPDGAGFHARPTFDGGVCVGADDIDEQHGGANGTTMLSGTTALLHRASEYLPGFPALEFASRAHARIGVRPMPEDGLPIVGALAATPGVYVVATHSGITLGPHLGDLVARELVLGERQADLEPYRPQRFGQ